MASYPLRAVTTAYYYAYAFIFITGVQCRCAHSNLPPCLSVPAACLCCATTCQVAQTPWPEGGMGSGAPPCSLPCHLSPPLPHLGFSTRTPGSAIKHATLPGGSRGGRGGGGNAPYLQRSTARGMLLLPFWILPTLGSPVSAAWVDLCFMLDVVVLAFCLPLYYSFLLLGCLFYSFCLFNTGMNTQFDSGCLCADCHSCRRVWVALAHRPATHTNSSAADYLYELRAIRLRAPHHLTLLPSRAALPPGRTCLLPGGVRILTAHPACR